MLGALLGAGVKNGWQLLLLMNLTSLCRTHPSKQIVWIGSGVSYNTNANLGSLYWVFYKLSSLKLSSGVRYLVTIWTPLSAPLPAVWRTGDYYYLCFYSVQISSPLVNSFLSSSSRLLFLQEDSFSALYKPLVWCLY